MGSFRLGGQRGWSLSGGNGKVRFFFRRREASIYVPMSVGRSVGRLVGWLVGLQKILKNKKDEVSRVI